MGGADPTADKTDKTAKTAKPYSKLVEDAILSLKEVESQLSDPFNKTGKKRYKGTTIQSVIKFILQQNDFPDETKSKQQIKLAAKKMLNKKTLINISGNGLNGRFKLSDELKASKTKKPSDKKSKPKKPAAKKKAAPKSKTADSATESESDDESNEEEEQPLPNKPKVKGKLPKGKVVSKVVKKASKPAKKIADLTKPPPMKNDVDPEPATDEPAPAKSSKPKATKSKAPKKATASKTKSQNIYDEIMNDNQESDKENEASPVKKTIKTAKKTKIVPQKKAPTDTEEESPQTTVPISKSKAKGKAKAAKKPVYKPVYTESESGSDKEF
ncbi:hypothetical protein ACHWQZ_G005072 [Mnemiopsis leidyi]